MFTRDWSNLQRNKRSKSASGARLFGQVTGGRGAWISEDCRAKAERRKPEARFLLLADPNFRCAPVEVGKNVRRDDDHQFVSVLLLAVIDHGHIQTRYKPQAWDPAHRTRVGLRNRSEEHTSELQSLRHLVCRLLL